MAEAMIIDSRLRLNFETGVNEKGEPTYKVKTYSNIRKGATAAELYQAGQALGGLSAHLLVGVERTVNFEIVG